MSNTATKTKPKAKADALQELDRLDPVLQEKLRVWKDEDTMHVVSKVMNIGRESLFRYLHDEPIHTSMLRAIQVTLRALDLPEPRANASRR